MRNYTILLLTLLFFSCTKEKNYENQNSLNPTYLVEKITTNYNDIKEYFYDSIGRIKSIKYLYNNDSTFKNYFYNGNLVTVVSPIPVYYQTFRLNSFGFSDSSLQIATKKGRWLIFTSKFEPDDLISFTKVDIYDTTYGKHGNDNFDKSYSYTYKYFPNNIAEMYFEGNIYNYFLLKKDNELYETYKLEYFTNLTNENIHDFNNTTKKVIDTNDPNYKILEYTTSQGIYTVYLRKK